MRCGCGVQALFDLPLFATFYVHKWAELLWLSIHHPLPIGKHCVSVCVCFWHFKYTQIFRNFKIFNIFKLSYTTNQTIEAKWMLGVNHICNISLFRFCVLQLHPMQCTKCHLIEIIFRINCVMNGCNYQYFPLLSTLFRGLSSTDTPYSSFTEWWAVDYYISLSQYCHVRTTGLRMWCDCCALSPY